MNGFGCRTLGLVLLTLALGSAGDSYAQQSIKELQLVPRSTYGRSDTSTLADLEVFENLSSGVSASDSVVYFIDLGTNRISRLIVSDAGEFHSIRWGGARGHRVVGRFLSACCLAFDVGQQRLLLGEPSGVITEFSSSLQATGRWAVQIPEHSWGQLAAIWTGGMDTVFAVVAMRDREAVIRISGPGIDTLVADLTEVAGRQARDTSNGLAMSGPPPASPAAVMTLPDGGVVIGSSQQPIVVRLGPNGRLLWRRQLVVPPVPDLVAPNAPLEVRLASVRVSSVVAVGGDRFLVTLFRPGRPQTIVKLLTLDGVEVAAAVLPIPVWYYGVARGKFLVAAQVSDRHELASYELQF